MILQERLTPVGVFFNFNALRNATDAYLFESRVVIRRFAARRLRPWTGLAPAAPVPPPPAAHGSVAGTSVPEVNVRAVGLAAEHDVGGVVQQWPVAVGAHVIGNACAKRSGSAGSPGPVTAGGGCAVRHVSPAPSGRAATMSGDAAGAVAGAQDSVIGVHVTLFAVGSPAIAPYGLTQCRICQLPSGSR